MDPRCKECHAAGYVEIKRNDKESVVIKCPSCDGTGYIKPKKDEDEDEPTLHETIVGDDYSLIYHKG
jgi:NAD-dependent SIR2 family protein deacetylase